MSSAANASAAARFPVPGGPWKRYACAGPSARAAASSRFASPCSGKLSKLSTDQSREVLGRLRRIGGDDTPREQLGELAVRRVDLPPELRALALDAVVLAAALCGLVGIDQQQDRLVGEQAARRLEVQLEHAVDAEAARDSLVCERRVDVAVADHVGAALERRRDHAVDELRARGCEEQSLRPRPGVV